MAKVIFLHLFVILFTVGRGEGVCLSACWDTTPRTRPPPWEQTPPGADTPLGADPPEPTPQSRPPGPDTPRTRHPPDQTPPIPDTPPQEADSSIRSTSGQYASYWNAFLLHMSPVGAAILVVYRMEFDKTRWSCSWNSDQNCTQNFAGVVGVGCGVCLIWNWSSVYDITVSN